MIQMLFSLLSLVYTYKYRKCRDLSNIYLGNWNYRYKKQITSKGPLPNYIPNLSSSLSLALVGYIPNPNSYPGYSACPNQSPNSRISQITSNFHNIKEVTTSTCNFLKLRKIKELTNQCGNMLISPILTHILVIVHTLSKTLTQGQAEVLVTSLNFEIKEVTNQTCNFLKSKSVNEIKEVTNKTCNFL